MGADGLLGGRYRIDHVAGHGGMGTVFAAYDTVLDRTVAIKLLQHRKDGSGVFEERFRREARAEAKLVHPNVVAVHDVGESDDGRPYIVMDYVEGRPLSEVLAEGPLDSERAALLGIGIARALAAAHEAGIVHRDVKPGNVLIDSQGLPHLTDFGLARTLDTSESDVSAPGAMVGTAHYISPEQARYGTASPEGDLYSLGALLYHAAVGEPPFPGVGAIDIAVRHIEEDAPPVASRVPGIDPGLAELIDALLTRDPARRPHSAAAVAERLIDIGARLHTVRVAWESITGDPG